MGAIDTVSTGAVLRYGPALFIVGAEFAAPQFRPPAPQPARGHTPAVAHG